MSNHIKMTECEIISLLERSSLPISILIEGKDDFIIYRRLEHYLDTDVDVFGVGGRSILLSIFNKQVQGKILKNKNIIYIADKDIWFNIGIPEAYQNPKLIFTSGYSIENDIFIDYKCNEIIQNSNNKKNYLDDLEKFLFWYALALQTKISNINTEDNIPENRKISKHPREVINKIKEITTLNNNEEYPIDLLEQLKIKLPLSIRGKSLLDIFTQNYSHHKKIALFEQVAVRPDEYILKIFDAVKQQSQLPSTLCT